MQRPIRSAWRRAACGLLLLGGLAPLAAGAQRLALSFDDGFDPRAEARAPAWNAALLHALDAAQVRAILYPAGARVDSPAGLALVADWGRAGHAIGNHTYRHASLAAPATSLGGFIADVERNEALLRDLPGWTARLRFPYLKEGDTAAKRDGLRAWLAAHHYASGAVSIDASDWYYDQRYDRWRAAHPGADPAPFRRAYLEHLWSRAQYYDGLSRRLLHRSASHVLLLHTNRINAEFLPAVIAWFRARGWTFVSPAEAYADPLYAQAPAQLPAGESLLWALARQAGLPGLRYPAEDDTYERPRLDRQGL